MAEHQISTGERVRLLGTGETGKVVGRGHDFGVPSYVLVNLDGQAPTTKQPVLLSRLAPLEEKSRRMGSGIVPLASGRQGVGVSDLGPLVAACAQLSAGGYLCVRRGRKTKSWKVNVRRAGQDWITSGANLKAALTRALQRLRRARRKPGGSISPET